MILTTSDADADADTDVMEVEFVDARLGEFLL